LSANFKTGAKFRLNDLLTQMLLFRFSYIHIADLSDAYRRVIEAPVNIIDKEIFNVVDFSHPTNEEVDL